MAIDKVKAFFAQYGMEKLVLEFEVSSATVELAAQAVGVIGARIAKTLSFAGENSGILIVTAGDAKIDNVKFKAFFHRKATMLSADEVVALTGHAVGGVCPFAIDPAIPVYLDESMQRFDMIYPACGSASSAVGLTPEELFRFSGARQWIDVCKGWQEEA